MTKEEFIKRWGIVEGIYCTNITYTVSEVSNGEPLFIEQDGENIKAFVPRHGGAVNNIWGHVFEINDRDIKIYHEDKDLGGKDREQVYVVPLHSVTKVIREATSEEKKRIKDILKAKEMVG